MNGGKAERTRVWENGYCMIKDTRDRWNARIEMEARTKKGSEATDLKVN